MNDKELLARATRFDGGPPIHLNGVILPEDWNENAGAYNYSVQLRRNAETGANKWAICNHGSCLSKSTKHFIFEGMNSNRTEAYIADTRFDSLHEAFEFLAQWRVAERARVTLLGFKVWKPL